MDLVDLINTRRFLGNEFLLWLWFKSECFEAQLHTDEHDTLEVWIDDALTLEAYLAETERNTISGGSPAYSPEAKTALRHGKRPTKAKLGVVKEGREWTFTLKAEDLSFSGVKIPALLSREEEEQFYERMFLLEELEQIVATLYQEFLTIRLDVPTWNEVMLPALKEWVQRDEVCTTEHYPSQVLKDRLGIVTHPRLVASA
jgi:hypothetical protein